MGDSVRLTLEVRRALERDLSRERETEFHEAFGAGRADDGRVPEFDRSEARNGLVRRWRHLSCKAGKLTRRGGRASCMRG